MYASISCGSPFITPANFERGRIRVVADPGSKDANGMRYSIQYAYLMSGDVEKIDYLNTILPTLSAVYGCAQRPPPNDAPITPDIKYEMCLGYRVDELPIPGVITNLPIVELDKNNRVVSVKERKRELFMSATDSGDIWRDRVSVDEKHAQSILDTFHMICEIESEVIEQACMLHCQSNKSAPFVGVNRIIRPSTKNSYRDLHSKFRQFKNKTTNKMYTDMPVFLGDTGKYIPLSEFLPRSGGARVAAWVSFPSLYVGTTNLATLSCNIMKAVCKSFGDDPISKANRNGVDVAEIPDNEEVDPEMVNYKRQRVQEEVVDVPEDAESVEKAAMDAAGFF